MSRIRNWFDNYPEARREAGTKQRKHLGHQIAKIKRAGKPIAYYVGHIKALLRSRRYVVLKEVEQRGMTVLELSTRYYRPVCVMRPHKAKTGAQRRRWA